MFLILTYLGSKEYLALNVHRIISVEVSPHGSNYGTVVRYRVYWFFHRTYVVLETVVTVVERINKLKELYIRK